jgi:hypothetical protein
LLGEVEGLQVSLAGAEQKLVPSPRDRPQGRASPLPARGDALITRSLPADGRLDRIRLVETAANGQPALAAYLPDATGLCRGYGVMVLTVTSTSVAEITGFPDPDVFGWFNLDR